MNAHQQEMAGHGGLEMLKGADAIAAFLSTIGGHWTRRQIWHAKETGALPIRKKPGIGVYAFKSELVAALKSPETIARAS